MPDFYIYLVSTLPALSFGAKPPITTDKLFQASKDFIPGKDYTVLENLRDKGIFLYEGRLAILKKWRDFNVALNNELVKIRAVRKHVEPAKYLRGDGYAGYEVSHLVLSAHRKTSPREGEMILDQERWSLLDELCIGHYFDLEFLIVYMLKLAILERWDKISAADKKSILGEVLTKD